MATILELLPVVAELADDPDETVNVETAVVDPSTIAELRLTAAVDS